MSIIIPAFLPLLEEIISTPSVSCTNLELDQSNRPVINLLANWFETLGFQIEIQDVNDDGSKANLIATAGTGTEGLVLAGHTDTVPYDENCWQYDPFALSENENKLYGLGTADMKSFFALVIDAIRELDLQKLKQPLIILATADEETSMAGAKALSRKSLSRARTAIIGEPTNLTPVRMHKGILMESIRLQGLSGHSSNPALGHNAMEAMHEVMSNLMKWRDELKAKYNNSLFAVPYPTINFGHIHGGDNPNRICGDCELHIDIRTLPGMKLEDLRVELNQRLNKTLMNTNIHFETIPLFDGIESMETHPEAELVQIVENLTGSQSEAVAFGTEAPFLTQMGIDTVVLGAGSINQAHQPDEYLATRQIAPAVDVLKNVIKHYCL